MTATASPGRARPAVRLPVLVGYVYRACLPRRRRAVLALPCVAILGAGLLALTASDESIPHEGFARVSDVLIFGLALPLGALVIGDAVLGAEVRSGTLAFSWLTPARPWELAVARWFGGWTIALVTLVPAAAVAAVIAGAGDHADAIALGAAAGTGAHVALFVAIGALTRRAAVWSLAILLLVERLLGAVLSGVAQLSPTWLGRAVYTDFATVPADLVRSGIPAGWSAVGRLAVLVVVFLALTVWGLRNLELTGARD